MQQNMFYNGIVSEIKLLVYNSSYDVNSVYHCAQ